MRDVPPSKPTTARRTLAQLVTKHVNAANATGDGGPAALVTEVDKLV